MPGAGERGGGRWLDMVKLFSMDDLRLELSSMSARDTEEVKSCDFSVSGFIIPIPKAM